MTEVKQRKKLKIILTIKGQYTQEVRCAKCNALLFKAKLPLNKSVGIEVKCRKCGHLNRF